MYATVVDAMVEQGRLTEVQVAEAMQKASAMEGVRFSVQNELVDICTQCLCWSQYVCRGAFEYPSLRD